MESKAVSQAWFHASDWCHALHVSRMRSASWGYLADESTKAAIVSCVLYESAWLLHGTLHHRPLHPATGMQD